MANNNSFKVFAVSDATGALSYHLAQAATHQFEAVEAKIIRRGRVNSEKKIRDVIIEAKEQNAVILFTMVSQDFRRTMLSEAKKENVVAMDVMGPALDMLSHYFHSLPLNEPGLQYRVTQDYYKRTEAIDFAVRHDDGVSQETFNQADIVILGPSRTSKTPISIYLAYQGFRCANLTIVNGMPLPPVFETLDRSKIIGLTISAEKLVAYRASRLKKLGRPESELYAQTEHVEKELKHAMELFHQLNIQVLEVTGKAIEEIASEVIDKLQLEFTHK